MSSFPAKSRLYAFQIFNALSFWIIIKTPMVLLVAWLGGGSGAVGLVIAIMPFLTILQIPSTRWISKLGYRRTMLMGWAGRTMVLSGFVLIPLLADTFSTQTLVGAVVVIMFCWSLLRGMANAAWLPWLRALVPEEQRGRFLAGEHRYIQLMGLLIFFFSGLILGKDAGPLRFSLIFLISFCSAIVSLKFLSRIPHVKIPERDKTETSLLKSVRDALSLVNFRRFLMFCFSWTVANKGFEAFAVLFMKRHTPFTDRGILWLGAASSIGMICVLFFSGKLMDKWGSRPIVNLCLFGTFIYYFLWFLISENVIAESYPLLAAVYFFYGAIRATIWISMWRLTMMFVPRDYNLVALAIYTSGMGILAGATPLVWGVILDRLPADAPLSPFGWFFLAGVVLNMVTFFMLQRVEEEKAEPTVNVALQIFLQPVQSFSSLMAYIPRSQHLPSISKIDENKKDNQDDA